MSPWYFLALLRPFNESLFSVLVPYTGAQTVDLSLKPQPQSLEPIGISETVPQLVGSF